MRRFFVWVFLLSVAGVFNATAQVADTTQAPAPDSLVVAPPDSLQALLPDSLQAGPPPDTLAPPPPRPLFDFPQHLEGRVLSDSLPARTWTLDGPDLLRNMQGSFTYDFGAAGWPDGWSPFALDPNRVHLKLQGLPFQDALTGRPLFEMLPWAVLEPLRLENAQDGHSLGVNGWMRPFDQTRPLTEVRYQSSNNGLQSAYVTHTQTRRLTLFGERARLGFLLTYGGHGAKGEYASNRLRGARQVFFRMRLQHPIANVELLEMSSRRRVGAHGGIQPIGSIYESIYNRFSAQAATPSARRENLRNDLMLTVHKTIGFKEPLTVSGYWTSHIGRYFVTSDSLSARTGRLGYRIFQALPYNAGRASLTVEGGREKLISSNVLPDSLGLKRSDFHMVLRNVMTLGPAEIDANAGWHKDAVHGYAAGSVRATLFKYLYAEAIRSAQPISWIEQYGWGGTVLRDPDTPQPMITRFSAGIETGFGPLDVNLEGFYHQRSKGAGFFATGATDTLHVQTLDAARWAGVTATVGFRRLAERGIYLTLTPTYYKMLNADASSFHTREANALPEAYIQGRLGMRYLLFKADLDMDLYVQSRLWSPFNGRTLHPQTGLLVVREDGAREIDASAAVDVVLEAGVRTAKLFVSFENILSGTSLIIGNLIVPDYPLPQRRFRFGVYWPIFD